MEPSFSGALGFAFRARHGIRFILFFAAAFSLIHILLAIAVMWGLGRVDPGVSLPAGIVWCALAVILVLTWTLFEAASQRRYIRGKFFSLGFGADEVRIFTVGVFWTALRILISTPLIIYGAGTLETLGFLLAAIGMVPVLVSDGAFNDTRNFVLWLFVVIPVYAYIATRLAPSFAMTIRDKKVRFLTAWRLTRGQVIKLFSAYLIIMIGFGAVWLFTMPIVNVASLFVLTIHSSQNEGSAPLSGMVPIWAFAIQIFSRSFLLGLFLHVSAGPAAYFANEPFGYPEKPSKTQLGTAVAGT